MDARHDGYPNYELYINGQAVYAYDHNVGGGGVFALLPPMEKEGHNDGQLVG